MNKIITLIASAAMSFGAASVAQAETTGTAYDGYLCINMAGEPIVTNQKATVNITPTSDGKCDFLLPNLTLADMGSIGDIELHDVNVSEDAAGVKTYSKESTPMEFLGGEIKATVSLNGTIDAEGNVNMTIPVVWDASGMELGDINIDVTFSSKPTGTEYTGYLCIGMAGESIVTNQQASVYIISTSDTTCNFLLPNLTLADMGTIGDIELSDVTVSTVDGVTTYTKASTPMEFLGGEIKATVSLNGTIDADGNVDMTIPVVWDASGMELGDINIDVTFSSKPAGTEYDGYLCIDMAGEPIVTDQPASVYIINTSDTTCDFLLPNLTLADMGSIGDIELHDVTVSTADGVTTYTKAATPMEFLGGEIKASVSLNGTVDANGKVNMTIPVIWDASGMELGDINIGVTFTSDPTKESGIANISAANGVAVYGETGAVKVIGVDGNVTIYNIAGVKLAETTVANEATIAAPAGVAIVVTPAGAAKVIVK
jgi:hypothetical protein